MFLNSFEAVKEEELHTNQNIKSKSNTSYVHGRTNLEEEGEDLNKGSWT
jgi:hypothetical protein